VSSVRRLYLTFFLLLLPAWALALTDEPATDTLRLDIGEWEFVRFDEQREWLHQRRFYTWLESGKPVRSCSEYRYGDGTVKRMKNVIGVQLSLECDFLRFGERGWELDPQAKRSREAYLAQWEPAWKKAAPVNIQNLLVSGAD